MRIIKLSTDEFSSSDAFDKYIKNDLPSRQPLGLFLCGLQLGKDGLDIGERLVFTLMGRVIYIARAASNVMDNEFLYTNDYRRCFQIDLAAAQPVNISLVDFAQRMQAAGVKVSTAGRGWNKTSDSTSSENVIASIVNQ